MCYLFKWEGKSTFWSFLYLLQSALTLCCLEIACLYRAVTVMNVMNTYQTKKWITGSPSCLHLAPTHQPCCLRRKVNLKGSPSLLCVGICVCESPALCGWHSAADITKILMWGAWDCFKVVKEIKAQKRIWAAVHCYRTSVGGIETGIIDPLLTALWWMHHKKYTQPSTDFWKFNLSAI